MRVDRFLFLLAVIVVISLITVWEHSTAIKYNYMINRLHNERAQYEKENIKLDYQFSRLSAPEYLNRRVRQFRLKLLHPAEWAEARYNRFDGGSAQIRMAYNTNNRWRTGSPSLQ